MDDVGLRRDTRGFKGFRLPSLETVAPSGPDTPPDADTPPVRSLQP